MEDPVLLYPKVTEKTSRLIESENKLVFVVSDKSTRDQIKRAFEKKYGLKVKRVNTSRTFDGKKLAYIRLEERGKASELALKLKIL